MLNINLLSDRVLVKLTEPEKKIGTVIVPNEQKKTKIAEVIAIGPGKDNIPMVLEPGDIVLFGEYSGIEVEIEGQNLLLLTQEEVFMYNRKEK